MHHVLPYSDFCLYWCLAYIREGISDLRIYVAVTSPYPPDRGVTKSLSLPCPEDVGTLPNLVKYCVDCFSLLFVIPIVLVASPAASSLRQWADSLERLLSPAHNKSNRPWRTKPTYYTIFSDFTRLYLKSKCTILLNSSRLLLEHKLIDKSFPFLMEGFEF